MLADWLPIAMLLGVSTLFGVASLWVSSRLGHPQRPNPNKLMPYDCGITSEDAPRDPFPVKFYLVSMLFIIFDVEVVFFYPWAVIYREMHLFGLAEMGVFVSLLLVAYIYVWKAGGLDWYHEVGDAKRRYDETRSMRQAS